MFTKDFAGRMLYIVPMALLLALFVSMGELGVLVMLALILLMVLFEFCFLMGGKKDLGFFGWACFFVYLLMGLFLVFKWLFVIVFDSSNHTTNLVYLLVMALSVSVLTDSGAYLGGKLFGKRLSARLCKSISPNKTWIGAFIGVVFGSIGYAFAYYVFYAKTGFEFLLVGFYLAVVVVLADLAQSKVKRSLGVKDSSTFLGPHGGFYDRFDTLIPVMFLMTV